MSQQAPAPLPVRLALHLREHGPATVTQLAHALLVSRTSVETSLGALLDSGLVGDAPAEGAKGAGRPARRFAFQDAGGVVVGVDVGAHSIRVVLADLSGAVIAQTTAPGLDADADGATQLVQVVQVVTDAAHDAGIPLNRFRAVGVSLPGIVDDGGRVIASVVAFGREQRIPVSLCGDAGGDPASIPGLLEAGLRDLSVAPAQLAMAKAAIADVPV